MSTPTPVDDLGNTTPADAEGQIRAAINDPGAHIRRNRRDGESMAEWGAEAVLGIVRGWGSAVTTPEPAAELQANSKLEQNLEFANDPALAVLRVKLDQVKPCGASEGGMGVDCHLIPGHDGWHNASHNPRTDGSESIGYPFHIQWPRTEWDRCAVPAGAAVPAPADTEGTLPPGARGIVFTSDSRGWTADCHACQHSHTAPTGAEVETWADEHEPHCPAPASPAGGGVTATEEREDAEGRETAGAIVPGRFGCVLVDLKPEWNPGDKAVWRIDAGASGEPVEIVKVVGTTALVAAGDHRYTVDTAELSPPAAVSATAHERTDP